jgi:hypothetical protein
LNLPLEPLAASLSEGAVILTKSKVTLLFGCRIYVGAVLVFYFQDYARLVRPGIILLCDFNVALLDRFRFLEDQGGDGPADAELRSEPPHLFLLADEF